MPCPICKRPAAPDYRPFCSRRCADVDLAKWLNGAYAVPVEEHEDWAEDTPGTDEAWPDRTPLIFWRKSSGLSRGRGL